MLTIDQILAAEESKVVEVPMPEWGGSVFVRKLSALESLRMFMELRETPKGTEAEIAEARLIRALASYLCDANGNPIATVEQARAIAQKSAGAVDRIVRRAQELNATGDASLEAMAKNSVPDPAATSPSG